MMIDLSNEVEQLNVDTDTATEDDATALGGAGGGQSNAPEEEEKSKSYGDLNDASSSYSAMVGNGSLIIGIIDKHSRCFFMGIRAG